MTESATTTYGAGSMRLREKMRAILSTADHSGIPACRLAARTVQDGRAVPTGI
jgi:hypothetical protein